MFSTRCAKSPSLAVIGFTVNSAPPSICPAASPTISAAVLPPNPLLVPLPSGGDTSIVDPGEYKPACVSRKTPPTTSGRLLVASSDVDPIPKVAVLSPDGIVCATHESVPAFVVCLDKSSRIS